jgi:hypothetical protein
MGRSTRHHLVRQGTEVDNPRTRDWRSERTCERPSREGHQSVSDSRTDPSLSKDSAAAEGNRTPHGSDQSRACPGRPGTGAARPGTAARPHQVERHGYSHPRAKVCRLAPSTAGSGRRRHRPLHSAEGPFVSPTSARAVSDPLRGRPLRVLARCPRSTGRRRAQRDFIPTAASLAKRAADYGASFGAERRLATAQHSPDGKSPARSQTSSQAHGPRFREARGETAKRRGAGPAYVFRPAHPSRRPQGDGAE